MRSFFASRSSGRSTRYEPATRSYSWGSGNRSFWIRVTYSTSAVGTTSSRRCVMDTGVPVAFTSSTISHGISSPGGETRVREAPKPARAVAIEWTVRPYFRSPTRAMLWPSIFPFSSQIVYRSWRVCVGCWPAPSPALITGRSVNSAARRAAPSCGCLRTITSAYPSTIRTVSASVSPFWTDVPSTLENPRTPPPRRMMALSKLSRVRVEGSKNRDARIRPSRLREDFCPSAIGAIFRAYFRIVSMSPREKSRIERMSRPFHEAIGNRRKEGIDKGAPRGPGLGLRRRLPPDAGDVLGQQDDAALRGHVLLPVLGVLLDLLRPLDAHLRDDLFHDLVHVDPENLSEQVLHPVPLARLHGGALRGGSVYKTKLSTVRGLRMTPPCREGKKGFGPRAGCPGPGV